MLHTIHFLTDVNVQSVRQLTELCLNAITDKNYPASEIRLYISSKGGDTVAGFTAYNLLKSLGVKITTHNLSNVESIANVIFMAGHERVANPLARFLLHPLHWGFGSPQADHLRIREWAQCLDDDLDRFVKVLDLETQGLNFPEKPIWHDIISSATIVDSTSACSLGMIHRVEEAMIPKESIRWYVTC